MALQEGPPARRPDPRRSRVELWLRERVGEGSAQFYVDGSDLADGVLAPQTASHLIGHCAREIESAVREVLMELLVPRPHRKAIERRGRKQGRVHRLEIEAILRFGNIDALRREAAFWLDLATGRGQQAGLAKIAHRRHHRRARAVDEDVRRMWWEFEALLIVMLDAIGRRFAAVLPRIEELAGRTAVGGGSLSDFQKIPHVMVTQRVFFERATPAWLPVLDEARFFDEPPLPVRDPETGAELLPAWPAADYLARVAKEPEHQERVEAILTRIPIPHEFAGRSLLAAMSALPPERRARCAAALTIWVRAQRDVWLIGQDIADFAAELARDRATAPAAAALVAALLDVARDPQADAPRTEEQDLWYRPQPHTRLRDWDYEHSLERALPPLIEGAPDLAFDTLLALTERALEYSERPELAEKNLDTSVYWFPSVAQAHGRSVGHTPVPDLARALVEAAMALCGSDPLHAGDAVDRLDGRGWPLLRRMALHLANALGDRERVRRALLDPELLERSWPEYDELARKWFPTLSEEDRRAHVALVERRTPRTAYASGQPIDAGDAARWLAAWRGDHLRRIADGLPDDLRARFADELRIGAPAAPAADAPPPVSDPLTSEEIRSLPIRVVIERLRTWDPPGNLIAGPSIEGQAGELRAAVAEDPAYFAEQSPLLRELSPTYVRHFFWGLDQAAEKRRPFPWARPLALAAWVIDQPIGETPSPMDRQDRGWAWTRKEIADLLRDGLEEPGAVGLTTEDRQAVWTVLTPLTRPATSTGIGSESSDPLSAALSTTHGSAALGIIGFIEWIAGDAGGPAIEVAPDAGNALDDMLDPSKDATPATRGAIGSQLARLIHLDRGWVEARRTKLFPADAPQLARWTWRSFIQRHRSWCDGLEIFATQYRTAIAELDGTKSERPSEYEERLAEHVIRGYLLGCIGSEDGGLVRAFFAAAAPTLRAAAIAYVGQVLHDSRVEDLKPEHCVRAQDLWTWRRSALEAMDLRERRPEAEAFGWWFVSGRCDENWLMRELLAVAELVGSVEPDSRVMDRLAQLAPSQPAETVRAVDLLTVQPKERWFIDAAADEITTVLRAGVADAVTRQAANDVINRLVATGYLGFASLLLRSNS